MKRISALLLSFSLAHAARFDVGEEFKKGNLSLPTSQMPSPLFAFGQNIVDKHDFVAYIDLYYSKGHNRTFANMFPSVLYGVRDDFSLYFNAPFTPQNKIDGHSSHGLEDMFIQGEYLFFNKDKGSSATQATLVGALFFPTGNAKTSPPLGVGSYSFLLGATLSNTSADWYWFLSPFVYITTTKHHTKFGNDYFYQGGFGRNLYGKADKLIITLMLELYGIYSSPDIINGLKDVNSGGNIFYAGPQLYVSTQHLIAQIGLLGALTQQLNGCQNKNRYIFGISLGWKFNR